MTLKDEKPSKESTSLSNIEDIGSQQDFPTPSSPSVINVLLLCLSLIGLGAIGGYLAFNQLIITRCATLLSATENRHNVTYSDLRTKYESALDDAETARKAAEAQKGQCSAMQAAADTTARLKAELDEMNGRLEAHSTLAERHALAMEETSTLKATLEDVGADAREIKAKHKAAEASLREIEETVEKGKEEQHKLHREISNLNRSDSVLRSRLNKLLVYEKRRSAQTAIEKYGQGPHLVTLNLKFPTSQGEEDGMITLEMAPLSLMPHSVSTFLDMVSKGLYDGTSFYLGNEFNVIAGPENPAQNIARRLKKRFKYEGYEPALAYQEYNDEYQHLQYTVGFAGKPIGGPSFYVNMLDNSKPHGPPGTMDEAGIPIPGEPCFAKVVGGLDVLDRIYKMPKRSDESILFAEMVTIVSTNIMK